MNDELDTLLCARHPLIFAERHADRSVTAMCWGIECDDSWFPVIDALCTQLQWLTDHRGHPQVVATQVKDKFGSLRFHVRDASPLQRACIEQATALCLEAGRQRIPGREAPRMAPGPESSGPG